MNLKNLTMKLTAAVLVILFTGVMTAENHVLPGHMTARPPVIDGRLDENVWKSAVKLTGLKTFKPDFGKKVSDKTDIYITHDRDNVYVAFRCFASDVDQVKTSVTKRDNMFGDDLIGIIIDSFSDNQSGYGFFVNPQGIQGDGMMSSCGDLDPSADFIWYSKGRLDSSGYTVECRIPASSIRFPGKKKLKMGIMVIRQIVRTSETATYPAVPAESGAFLSHCVPVDFSGLKYRRVIEILPAFTSARSREHVEGEMAPALSQNDLSLTTKLGLTSGLTLDATVNPDFSQVEADAGQVDVNLRYDLFYDEKRPFFLEGMEIFRFAGNTESAPLHSIVHTRNIADPVFGLKLSGKLGSKSSIAAIYARDKLEAENNGPDRADFGIVRFRHALRKDSYLGGFLTSRKAGERFNRVGGADGLVRLSSASAAEFHILGSLTRTDTEEQSNSGHALAARYHYADRKFSALVGIQDVSREFQVDTGFLTRDGLTRLGAFFDYRMYPKSKFFHKISTFYWSFHLYDKYCDMMETFNLFTIRFSLPHTSEFRLDLIAGNEVFSGNRFGRNGFGTQFNSQVTKKVWLNVFFRRTGAIYYDEENPFGGKSCRLQVNVDYQPTEKFTSGLSIRYADFYRDSDGKKEYDYLIVRSRNTFQINKYLFVRGIGEYNTYRRRLILDFLASFTYIPGTVVHLGYGAAFDRLRWEEREYVNQDRFLLRKRGFFFKVSYLWRL